LQRLNELRDGQFSGEVFLIHDIGEELSFCRSVLKRE
jgi:hypothetical protein